MICGLYIYIRLLIVFSPVELRVGRTTDIVADKENLCTNEINFKNCPQLLHIFLLRKKLNFDKEARKISDFRQMIAK